MSRHMFEKNIRLSFIFDEIVSESRKQVLMNLHSLKKNQIFTREKKLTN